MTPPIFRLLHDGLLAHAKLTPDKTAVVAEGQAYSYLDLLNTAGRLAAILSSCGVRRGDRIAVYMDNTWWCVASIYAASLAGGAFLIINPQTKADKLAYILDDSDARVLITDSHLASVFVPVLPKLSKLAGVVCSGEIPDVAKVISLEKSMCLTPVGDPRPAIPLDLAALIYTSGSTGSPKGVMHTHQTMMCAAYSLVEYLRLGADDRLLCVLPLAFDYGLYQLLLAINLGATTILERSFAYPAQIFARIEEQGATVFPGVPTIFAMLLAAHEREPLCFASVRCVTNTAAALPDNYIPRLREIFPNALIYKMYGLTECKRVSYLEPELVDSKPGSVGKAIPGTEVYILSQDNKPAAPNEAGILYVRGPHVMVGYWKQPELSAHMLKPGTWAGERVLCTHDLFRMDAEGYLYFVARSDDIIKTRGEKVSPLEVENVLHSLPGVREAAVVGVPDDVLGQAIRAYVVPYEGIDLSAKQIRAGCLTRLENFMVPKEVVIVSELPRTMTGKVSKKALGEQSKS